MHLTLKITVLLLLSFQIVLVAHVTAKMSSSKGNKEKYFLTSIGENEPSSSLHDPSTRELSVVIPAYNEEHRSESPSFSLALFLPVFNVLLRCRSIRMIFVPFFNRGVSMQCLLITYSRACTEMNSILAKTVFNCFQVDAYSVICGEYVYRHLASWLDQSKCFTWCFSAIMKFAAGRGTSER